MFPDQIWYMAVSYSCTPAITWCWWDASVMMWSSVQHRREKRRHTNIVNACLACVFECIYTCRRHIVWYKIYTKGATTKCFFFLIFLNETILCKDMELMLYTPWILTSLRIYFNQKGDCVVPVPVNIIELIKQKEKQIPIPFIHCLINVHIPSNHFLTSLHCATDATKLIYFPKRMRY